MSRTGAGVFVCTFTGVQLEHRTLGSQAGLALAGERREGLSLSEILPTWVQVGR